MCFHAPLEQSKSAIRIEQDGVVKAEPKADQRLMRTSTKETGNSGKLGLLQKIDEVQNAVVEYGQDLRDLPMVTQQAPLAWVTSRRQWLRFSMGQW